MSARHFKPYRLLLLLASFASPALADELSVAEQAYAQGKYYAAGTRYQVLADNGDAQAQFRLGQMHATGKGVPQNFDTAVMWYRKAAAQSHAAAASELTKLALQGVSLTARPQLEDKHLGIDIPKKAADDDATDSRTESAARERVIERELVVWPVAPRKHPHRVKPAHGVASRSIWTPTRPYLPAPGTRYNRYR